MSTDVEDTATVENKTGKQSTPKKVCYNIDELTTFCPPCIGCSGLGNCGCTFNDGTVIQPKVVTNNIPPYCTECPILFCPRIPICDITQPCTAVQIQNLINK